MTNQPTLVIPRSGPAMMTILQERGIPITMCKRRRGTSTFVATIHDLTNGINTNASKLAQDILCTLNNATVVDRIESVAYWREAKPVLDATVIFDAEERPQPRSLAIPASVSIVPYGFFMPFTPTTEAVRPQRPHKPKRKRRSNRQRASINAMTDIALSALHGVIEYTIFGDMDKREMCVEHYENSRLRLEQYLVLERLETRITASEYINDTMFRKMRTRRDTKNESIY